MNTSGMRTVTTRPLSRAERRDRTAADLIAAADRFFVSQGFHATTVDQIAAAAGYTKGAVYSNFASKEDLFFAVYEQRSELSVAEVERLVGELGVPEAFHRLASDTTARRNRDDGWLAVYFEFWAHVLRHPPLRARFAAIHARWRQPLEAALERLMRERGGRPPFAATPMTVAMNALQVGLALEHLTDPDAVAADLGERISRLALGQLERNLATDGGAAHEDRI
jgi:AcrR family transcriptional regulator